MTTERKVTWRDRYPEGWVTCVRCLEVHDVMDLDRLLWCPACRAAARERAARWGWGVGLAFAAALGAWVWLTIRPSDLIPGAWLATFAAAVWMGSKVGREIAYGGMRFRNARAVEAVPPELPGAAATGDGETGEDSTPRRGGPDAGPPDEDLDPDGAARGDPDG